MSFLSPPQAPQLPIPPPPPKLENPEVQKRIAEEKRMAPGRASQFFSNPQEQVQSSPSRRQYLGGK